MLNKVTLTGADDSVSPQEIIKLSNEFDFVEFGILIGSGIKGSSRFPSVCWINKLCELARNQPKQPHLAIHACGESLDGLLTKINDPKKKCRLFNKLGGDIREFKRIQLNFHGGEINFRESENLKNNLLEYTQQVNWTPEVIYQLDGVNDWLYENNDVKDNREFPRNEESGLFDRSHGAGVTPDSWPKPVHKTKYGWAGGIGPDNIVESIKKINEIAMAKHDHWIDMETKLFECFQFSIEKCRKVLVQAMPFIRANEVRHKH